MPRLAAGCTQKYHVTVRMAHQCESFWLIGGAVCPEPCFYSYIFLMSDVVACGFRTTEMLAGQIQINRGEGGPY